MKLPNEPPRYGRTLYDLIAEVLERPRLLLIVASLVIILAVVIIVLANKGYVPAPWLGRLGAAPSAPVMPSNTSAAVRNIIPTPSSRSLSDVPNPGSTAYIIAAAPTTSTTENYSSQVEPPSERAHGLIRKLPQEQARNRVVGATNNVDHTSDGPALLSEKSTLSPIRSIDGTIWQRPAPGRILSRFDPRSAVPGVEIEGQPGEIITAACDGVVFYSGNGLTGYGEVTFVKVNEDVEMAYALTGLRLAKEGQKVSRGDPIARIGHSPLTHNRNGFLFQVRRDGNPVDPLGYLP